MNQRGSILIVIISIIGGVTLYLGFNKDQKSDQQKKQEMEHQVKKTFAPDLELMDK